MEKLDRTERLRLMRFVCSFVWADLQVRPAERRFIRRMVERLDLDADESEQVRSWLRVPPDPETVDPTAIPLEHRRIFLRTIQETIRADDEISQEESESLALFQQLLNS